MANTSTRFKKGQSGNPGGRPKLLADVQELARNFGPKKDTRRLIERLYELAESTNGKVAVAAIRELFDRGWGKPPATIELSGGLQPQADVRDFTTEELKQMRDIHRRATERRAAERKEA